MKFIILILLSLNLNAKNLPLYIYESNVNQPFGKVNPNAPQQIKDYQLMIGKHECLSVARNPDQSWGEPVNMIWSFKYIMNGLAIQDTTLKADGNHSGSIRLYDEKNNQWQINYYSSQVNPKAKSLPMWTGGKKDAKLVYYRDQKAPNGTQGYFRLSFYDISANGFKWIGEWTDKREKSTYPTWKIECKKKM